MRSLKQVLLVFTVPPAYTILYPFFFHFKVSDAGQKAMALGLSKT